MQETSQVFSPFCAQHPMLRASCKDVVNRSSLLHLQSRPQAARRWQRRLLALYLRHPAAGRAPRRRAAAALAQLEHVASDDPCERFCTCDHGGEHGSSSASGGMGQGALGAP